MRVIIYIKIVKYMKREFIFDNLSLSSPYAHYDINRSTPIVTLHKNSNERHSKNRIDKTPCTSDN
jgi:hypothetical protein